MLVGREKVLARVARTRVEVKMRVGRGFMVGLYFYNPYITIT